MSVIISVVSTKTEATKQYCATVEELVLADSHSSGGGGGGTSGDTSAAAAEGDYQDIVVTDNGGARTILLNRPQKYNAITFEVYYIFAKDHNIPSFIFYCV